MQSLFAVPARARGVHDAHDDLVHDKAPLGDLADDEVCVVAGGGRYEHVGALDPSLDQRVRLERGADGELTAGVLPALVLTGVQALVRERVLVEDRHFVTRCEGGLGDRGSHAAGADD